MRRTKSFLLTLVIIIALTSGLAPARSAGLNSKQDELTALIAEDSIIALKVNDLQNTLNLFDQYLQGTAPMPAASSMLVRMQLAGLLADPSLQALDFSGDFALFAQIPQTTEQQQMPTPAVFGIIPIADFGRFTSTNQNCSQPDKNGVATITSTNMTGQASKTIIKKIQDYTIISTADNYETLLNIADIISRGKTLAKVLSPEESENAAEEPVWVYLNFAQISKAISPQTIQQMQNMAAMFGGQQQNLPIQQNQIQQLVDMISGINSLSLTISPQPEVCLFTQRLSTRPDSQINQILSPQSPTAQMLMTLLNAQPPQQSQDLDAITTYLPDAEDADFVAKFNIVQLQKSATQFAPSVAEVPDVNFQTQTDAFCAIIFEANTLAYEIAIPKEHLREIIAYAGQAQQGFAVPGQKGQALPEFEVPLPDDQNLIPGTAEKLPEPVAPKVVEPIINLKGVKFGMTPEQMFEILGQPTSQSGDHYYYFNLGLAVIINSEGFSEEFICGSINPESRMIRNCNFSTKVGISLGDPKEDIIAAYGQPRKIHSYPLKEKGQTLEYQNINARFTFIEGDLVQMIFRNPR